MKWSGWSPMIRNCQLGLRRRDFRVMYAQLELRYGDRESRDRIAQRFFKVAERSGLEKVHEVGKNLNHYKSRVMEDLKKH